MGLAWSLKMPHAVPAFNTTPTPSQTQAYLQVFVEDASHSGEGAIIPLMFDEPGLSCTKLFRVNKDETPRLSKGLQHKCCQPRGRRDGGGGVRRIEMGEKKTKNYQEFDCNHFFNRVMSFPTSHTLSICQQRRRGADRENCRWRDVFVKDRRKKRTGMYRQICGNGKKRKEARRVADGCGGV